MTRKALEILESYPWPGNVRELRNIAERLIIMTPQKRIDIYDLPEAVLNRALPVQLEDEEAASLQDAKEKFEREYIQQKLIEQKGSVSRTAQALGVERSNLYRKLKQLGIPYSGKDNGE